MRVEPFTIGSYVHILKRGARGLNIVEDSSDKYRFLALLYYMNDEFIDDNWIRAIYESYSEGSLTTLKSFDRPDGWPPRKPLVKILCYTLMPNHFHLILQEISEGGVSKFMQKVGQSMTLHFNEKNNLRGKGSIFQGSYKSKTINEDMYMRYVSVYIMVKNTFELYPKGGLKGAQSNFNNAWEWAMGYEFSSLADYCGKRESPIIDKDILEKIFDEKNFKSFARDVFLAGKWEKKKGSIELARLSIE